jgi:hypothetical protein
MICALNRTNSYNKSINKTGPTDLQHFSHLSSGHRSVLWPSKPPGGRKEKGKRGSDKSNPRKKKLNLKHMKEYSHFAGSEHEMMGWA